MIETLDNAIAIGDDFSSQTAAPAGNVSVWAVKDGPAVAGYPSADRLRQIGIPFGHGSRKTIKGFQAGMVKGEDGKKRANTFKGPMGVELVEMYAPAEDFQEKQKWEAEVSNAQIASAKGAAVNGSSKVTDDPEQEGIRQAGIGLMTDEQRQIIEDQQLADLAAHAP